MKIIISFIILFALFGLMFTSCKTKASFDELAYHKIMDESVQLLAKEERGKLYTMNTIVVDTTSELYQKFKPQIDSLNAIQQK